MQSFDPLLTLACSRSMRSTVRVIPLLGGLLIGPALATDFVPTRYDDPSPDGCLADDCSLREAVIAANADPAHPHNIFLSAGTYALTLIGDDSQSLLGDLDLSRPTNLVGAGATMTLIDGSAIERVIESIGNLEARGLTILAGNATAPAAAGIQFSIVSLLLEDVHLRGQPLVSQIGVRASSAGPMTVRRSTVSGFTVEGIRISAAGDLQATNVTFSANEIDLRIPNGGTGNCTHCTFVGDNEPSPEVLMEGSNFQIRNSVVVGHCDQTTPLVSGGGNLESPGDTCGFSQSDDDAAVADPLLSGLGDFGGPTPTHYPLAGSLAIDAARTANCAASDQRGVNRPQGVGGLCDRGAVEVAGFLPLTPLFSDGFEQGNEDAWSSVTP